jgi:tRNA-dihydrouridine synthase
MNLQIIVPHPMVEVKDLEWRLMKAKDPQEICANRSSSNNQIVTTEAVGKVALGRGSKEEAKGETAAVEATPMKVAIPLVADGDNSTTIL